MAGDWARATMGLAMLLAAPLLMGGTGLLSNFDERVLAAHNRERAALGVPPLRWSDRLTASARVQADWLARTGRFEHTARASRAAEGENLWAGTRGAYSAEAMVDGWAGEKRVYRPGPFPANSATGSVADVGHYTQLMWRRTQEIGCAQAAGTDDDVLVCRYSQAGNVVGERPF